MKWFTVLVLVALLAQATPVPDELEIPPKDGIDLPPEVERLFNVIDEFASVYESDVLTPMNRICLYTPLMISVPFPDLLPTFVKIQLYKKVMEVWAPMIEIVPDLKPALDAIFDSLHELLKDASDGSDDNIEHLMTVVLTTNNGLISAIVDAAEFMATSQVENALIMQTTMTVAFAGSLDTMMMLFTKIRETLTDLSEPAKRILDAAILAFTAAISFMTNLLTIIMRQFLAVVDSTSTILWGLPVVKAIIVGAEKLAQSVLSD